MKFCFVILHYMSEFDTCECIKSITDLYCKDDYHIIVVDNASSNGSGRNIYNKYQDDRNVTVLLQKENLGFARGNNVGYRYAKERFQPDFIIVINNDVLFIQKDFLEKIEEIYARDHFFALGPDILDLTQTRHQNPIRVSPLSKKGVEKIIQGKKVYLNAQKYGGIWKFIMAIYVVVEKMYRPVPPPDFSTIQYDCVLQGACIIFSESYIRLHNNAFFPGTFLYFEEDILKFLMDCDHEKMMYSPDLKLVHKEDRSTDLIVHGKKEKNIFKAEHMIESGKKLIALMEEHQDKTDR